MRHLLSWSETHRFENAIEYSADLDSPHGNSKAPEPPFKKNTHIGRRIVQCSAYTVTFKRYLHRVQDFNENF